MLYLHAWYKPYNLVKVDKKRRNILDFLLFPSPLLGEKKTIYNFNQYFTASKQVNLKYKERILEIGTCLSFSSISMKMDMLPT